jgi:chromosome segregation ATPase
MIIINATKIVKTILTSNGDIMTIEPGGKSELTVASGYLIRAAMKLGDPNEIGIVIDGSYEMQIASQITGSAPYLYTDINEAMHKLIDPNVDYTAKLDNSKNVLQLQDELAGKNAEIKKLQAEIGELNSRLTLAEASDLKADLEKQVRTLETEVKDLTSDKLRLQKQLEESQDQVAKNTETLNQIRQQVGEKDQLISQLNAQIKDLTSKVENNKSDEIVAELEAVTKENASLKESLAKWENDYSIAEADHKKAIEDYEEVAKKLEKSEEARQAALSNLKEAAETIDNMKTSFNAACEKFGLYLDDNGEWQQEKSSE